MASTYTPLGIELQATGENAGTWGTKTNTNLQIVEQISGGYTAVNFGSDADVALSVSDGSTGAALAHRVLEFTSSGSLTATRNCTIPLDVQQFYVLKNSTTGGQSITFKYVSGSGNSVTITNGSSVVAYAKADDGTNPNIESINIGGIASVVADTTPQLGGNLDVNGNDIVSTSNADIDIVPNGTGDVVLAADTVKVGDSGAAATLTSNGAGALTVTTGGTENLVLSTNSGTNSGTITITDGANNNIDISPNGTGDVTLQADTVQIGDNNADATLTTQGTGDLILNTNNGTNAGNITLADGANGNIDVSTNGTGYIKFNDLAYIPQQALTSSSNAVAWDVQAKPNAYHLTTENTTFSAPTNAVEGSFVSLEINYDGAHTIAFNTVFEFAGSTAPTFTSTDGKTDILIFRYNGSVFQEVGRSLNLSES